MSGRLPLRLGGLAPSGPAAFVIAAVTLVASPALGTPAVSTVAGISIIADTLAAAPALGVPTVDVASVTLSPPSLSAASAMGYPPFVGAYGSAGGLLRVDMQYGSVDLTPYITGMTITERMGSPDTLSLQLADLDSAISLTVIATLADIRVRLGTDYLFQGQITVPTTETINWQDSDGTWVAARNIDITAESYERLIPDALVSIAANGIGRIMPDGSYSNTLGYHIGFGYTDREQVGALFGSAWGWAQFAARPAIDVDTCVHKTGTTHVWWEYPVDNSTLGADFDALAAEASPPTLVHWLDARMRFHWADGADPTQLEAAPWDLSAVGFVGTFPNFTTLMTTRMKITTDAQNVRGQALVQGALPWASGVVSSGLMAPDVSISSGKAQTWEESQAFAARYFANDNRVGIQGTASIPDGYDGWHKGQWVHITDPGHGLAAQGYLIQEITARLLGGGSGADFEYDITFGDAPRRSLAQESANPDIPVETPAVRYHMRTDPEQSTPKPAAPVTIIAQLHDGIANVATAGIDLRWDLIIGAGIAEVDPTDPALAFYLDDATGTTNEQGQALTVAHTGTAFNPAAGLACTVEAVTEEPTP